MNSLFLFIITKSLYLSFYHHHVTKVIKLSYAAQLLPDFKIL